ncbi:helix-turn-helix domain-containing protein [Streptomyces goshikiensis]|uniref:helix-turn-helix domain-containing protein n=1 Tax=Streptomyces goshikiensis TaxID=1942 RepID=UPI0036512E19
MGRPEAPIDWTVPERGELALFLRTVRVQSGLDKPPTYDALARGIAWSSAALKRAASGRTLPVWGLVEGFLDACQADSSIYLRALRLHKRAEQAVALHVREARATTVVPRPQFVSDEADLSRVLRDAYGYAGRPPVRTMAARAGIWVLPHSSAHRIITARALPSGITQYIGFLEACVVPPGELPAWFTAWHKVMGPPMTDDPESELNWWRTPSWGEEIYVAWFYENFGQATEVAA